MGVFILFCFIHLCVIHVQSLVLGVRRAQRPQFYGSCVHGCSKIFWRTSRLQANMRALFSIQSWRSSSTIMSRIGWHQARKSKIIFMAVLHAPLQLRAYLDDKLSLLFSIAAVGAGAAGAAGAAGTRAAAEAPDAAALVSCTLSYSRP
jgi:hypothetical protein